MTVLLIDHCEGVRRRKKRLADSMESPTFELSRDLEALKLVPSEQSG